MMMYLVKKKISENIFSMLEDATASPLQKIAHVWR